MPSGRQRPARVLVVARQPVARAGIAGLLADRDEVDVVGRAASPEEAADLAAQLRPDAAVAVGSWADEDGVTSLLEALEAMGTPVVLLVGEGGFEAGGGSGWPAGLVGVLPAAATADDVVLALDAAARGLILMDPGFAAALRAPESTVAVGGHDDEALTDREREVLDLVALGLANKTIALRLGISEHTVKFHLGSVFAKLNVESRTEAVTVAARRGLIAL